MESLTEQNTAKLSSIKDYTIFKFGNYRLMFRAPYSLEKYTKIIEWAHGCIVVMAKYNNNTEDEEEYIDIAHILKILHFNVDEFLKPIRGVEIIYE